MAKKPKSTVNVDLLITINAASIAGGTFYISQADGLPLVQNNPPLIEVNEKMLDGAGNAAARLTDAGKAMLPGAAQPETAVSPFAILSGVVLPESKRGNRAGAPTQYPFDKLEVGQSFFVPKSEKHPDPVKTLGSTVSSANQRYAVPVINPDGTPQTKVVTRTKRGEKNKAVLNPDGTKAKETVTVPVTNATRKFAIRVIEAGKTYGTWQATEDGAMIARTV